MRIGPLFAPPFPHSRIRGARSRRTPAMTTRCHSYRFTNWLRMSWTMSSAIAYQRPGRIWDDTLGAVPTFQLPSPVGTIEMHRARRLDDRRVLIDARFVSGDLSRARFV